jgi:hypothetical protein
MYRFHRRVAQIRAAIEMPYSTVIWYPPLNLLFRVTKDHAHKQTNNQMKTSADHKTLSRLWSLFIYFPTGLYRAISVVAAIAFGYRSIGDVCCQEVYDSASVVRLLSAFMALGVTFWGFHFTLTTQITWLTSFMPLYGIEIFGLATLIYQFSLWCHLQRCFAVQ